MANAISPEFFKRTSRVVSADLAGRKITRKSFDGKILAEAVILEIGDFNTPSKKRTSPGWKPDYMAGNIWLNSRYGHLLINFKNNDGCSYIRKISMMENDRKRTYTPREISRMFGLDMSVNGKNVSDFFEIGDRVGPVCYSPPSKRERMQNINGWYVLIE